MKNPRAYHVYLVMNAAFALAAAVMFTVMSVYFVTGVGMDPLQLVLVGTALEGTVFVFEIPTGIVADVYSRRLSVILGHFALGAGFVLIGLVPLFSIVLLCQVITGLGYTFLSGATDAWLADEIGEEHVGTALLRSGQIERVVGIAGTLISVGLASLQLNLPMFVGGGLLLATGVFLVIFMPETGFAPTPRDAHARTTWQTLRGTFRDGARLVRRSPMLLLIFGIGFFWGAASEGFDRLGDAHLLTNFAFPALGALQPVVWFGILSIVADSVTFVVTEVFRRRLEAISKIPAATARVLIVLNGLMIAGVIAFALAGSFGLAVAMLLAYGVARSMVLPLYSAWLLQHVDPKIRATVLSMNGQTDAIGQIAGGPGIGLIGKLFSIRAAIAAAGVLLSPALLLYARAIRHTDVVVGEADALVVEAAESS
jgi:DHA3 family tetracycline resistance protein-like MFS transporter